MIKRVFSAHQPNILPYLGFWKKVVDADIFDISIYDQFTSSAYVNFVTFGDYGKVGSKATLKLEKSFKMPINKIKLKAGTQENFRDKIVNFYGHKQYADQVLPLILDVFNTKYEYMWQLNYVLLLVVRDMLGLKTQFVISNPVNIDLSATEEIIRLCKLYFADTYISGMAGKDYLDFSLFENHGIELKFQMGWNGEDKNSILSALTEFGISGTLELLKS